MELGIEYIRAAFNRRRQLGPDRIFALLFVKSNRGHSRTVNYVKMICIDCQCKQGSSGPVGYAKIIVLTTEGSTRRYRPLSRHMSAPLGVFRKSCDFPFT